jgi:anti-sigma factor RsiW
MSACPDKELLLHAFVDNELDAKSSLELESHIAGCAECRTELAGIRKVKAALAAAPLRYEAPQSLLDKLDAAIAAETTPVPLRPRRRRMGAGSWALTGGIGAMAASLAVLAFLPTDVALQTQLVDAQVRSLQASHLVDIPTSDRHVVKPWFNGKVDFAPPVAELAPQGFPLVGGRLDHVADHDVAAIVYRRRAHVINLFVWKGDGPTTPAMTHRQGYSLEHWGAGGLTYWAVSDVDSADLQTFQQAYTAAQQGGAEQR